MTRWIVLTLTAVALAVALAAVPAGACAADGDDPCLEDENIFQVSGRVYTDRDANGTFDPGDATFTGHRVFADLDHDRRWNDGEPQATTAPDGTYTLELDAASAGSDDTIPVRFAPWSDARWDPEGRFAWRCSTPPECVVEVPAAGRQRLTGRDFGIYGGTQIWGKIYEDRDADGVRDPGEMAAPGTLAWLDVDRDGEADGDEPQYSVGSRADEGGSDGHYALVAPTRFTGQTLPPIRVRHGRGGDCTAPDDCTISGVTGRSDLIRGNDFGIARPAVIFIHGYGGAEITCGGSSLWFRVLGGPQLDQMRLDPSGTRGALDSPCSAASAATGLLRSVAGSDIYGGASDHFEQLVHPGRHADFVWDWRMDPARTVEALDRLVERMRCQGEPPCAVRRIAKVNIVAHSMGGLVLRSYLADPQRAAKVDRAASVGTPYWGSPKAIFPLAAGIEMPVASAMDALMDNDDLRAATRTFPGHYTLLPSHSYGPWLKVVGQYGNRNLDEDQIEDYLRRIGANGNHYVNALSEHIEVLDHYDDQGVDLQIIVGAGMPTPGGVGIRHGVDPKIVVSWTSGDETVPAWSGVHDTPGDRLHYVCGVSHVPLTTAPATTALLDDWLIHGTPMRDEVDTCPWTATEVTFHDADTLSALPSAARGIRVRAAGAAGSMTAAEAEKAGLVQVIELGGQTTVVARPQAPVTIDVPKGVAVETRALSDQGSGPRVTYGPLPAAGTVAAGATATVRTRSGRTLRPVKADRRPPRTKVRLRRAGARHVVLVARARDASGVAATYVLVRGRKQRYTKPVRLPRAALGKVRVASVDRWGNAERPRKVVRRRR